METTPRKGISKGCLVGLIVGAALVVILITFIVLVYVFRGSLVKAGAAATIREVKTLLAKAPPDGVDTVQFNSLADAFVDRVNLENDDQFEALSGVMTQMYGVVKDKQVTREEALTTCAAIIGLYPELEQYWIPKQEDVTTQIQDSLGGE